MEVLQFIFSGFWTWLGCMMLLGLIANALIRIRLFTLTVHTGPHWETNGQKQSTPTPTGEAK